MADPRTGVASKNEFFSLAAVHEWLKAHGPQPQWKPLLPAPAPEVVPPEVREQRVAMLKDTARVIRETVKAKTVGRPGKTLTPKHTHNPKALLDGLENLKHLQHESAGEQ
jgi:hypothetical protein